MKRKASITRKTKETKIDVELNIDGKGQYKIDTGIGFLDHMLEQLFEHMVKKTYAGINFVLTFAVNIQFNVNFCLFCFSCY